MGGRNFLADGTLLGEDDYPPVVPGWPPLNGIPRPILHEILQTAVLASGANVRVGETVTEIVQRADGVDATFSDGTTGAYDLLVGADGLQSQTREMVFGDAIRPQYTGQACFRYNLPRLEGLDRIEVWIGGIHGTAGFVPLTDELMYMLFILAWPADQIRQDPARLDAIMREKLEPFGGTVAEQRELITDAAAVVYRPVENILMPAPWYRGRVLLIGDAAHATSPHAGQGAAQAIEDGVVLAEEIASGKSAQDVSRRVHGSPLRALQAGRRAVGVDRRLGAGAGPGRQPERHPQRDHPHLRGARMTRIVDLSFTIEPSPPDLPEFMRIDVSHTDHANGAG